MAEESIVPRGIKVLAESLRPIVDKMEMRMNEAPIY